MSYFHCLRLVVTDLSDVFSVDLLYIGIIFIMCSLRLYVMYFVLSNDSGMI